MSLFAASQARPSQKIKYSANQSRPQDLKGTASFSRIQPIFRKRAKQLIPPTNKSPHALHPWLGLVRAEEGITLVLPPNGDQSEHGRRRAPLGHRPPADRERSRVRARVAMSVAVLTVLSQLLPGPRHMDYVCLLVEESTTVTACQALLLDSCLLWSAPTFVKHLSV